jgi:polyhydroxyalkanoate synthesis repressor PhaR
MTTRPLKSVPGRKEDEASAKQGGGRTAELVIIKKYANRRLYNTETSAYVTLDNLAEMVRAERDFVVYDAKTGEELTRSVLTQIIVEQESSGGQNLLPIGFLRQLIRFYGHSLEGLVPSFLEFSIGTLTREQEKYQKQFADAFGQATFETLQEQARRNMALFEHTLTMFSPFTAVDGWMAPGAAASVAEERSEAVAAAPHPVSERTDELAQLRQQLAAMQVQIDKLSDKSG